MDEQRSRTDASIARCKQNRALFVIVECHDYEEHSLDFSHRPREPPINPSARPPNGFIHSALAQTSVPTNTA
ncbi:hypothetical protein L6164_018402 [Bauhinia variegata]|uniref:Uncharacterized protein n=1 Tax=Bauhinia variegata TaxID=167791 RepID=A0ACB9NC50_BAUVA|nr:hypothetical protein L6164_018402 [Bauhinia variegata]